MSRGASVADWAEFHALPLETKMLMVRLFPHTIDKDEILYHHHDAQTDTRPAYSPAGASKSAGRDAVCCSAWTDSGRHLPACRYSDQSLRGDQT